MERGEIEMSKTQTQVIIEMFEVLEKTGMPKLEIYDKIEETLGCPRPTIRRAMSMKLRGYWKPKTETPRLAKDREELEKRFGSKPEHKEISERVI